jgi:hypothetical protein
MTSMGEQGGEAHGQGRPAWPRGLRRGVLENVAILLIAAGVLMLLQPFSLSLYGYSFATTLAAVAMFMIVTKLPE